MDPKLITFTDWAALRGKNTSGGTPAPPEDSPLKVWTGAEWASVGVKVED